MSLTLDRRTLILSTAATAGTLVAEAASAQTPDRWRDALIINALGGLADPNVRGDGPPSRRPVLDPRILQDAHASGMAAVNITLGYVAGDEDPFEASISDIAAWDAAVRAHPADLIKVWGVEDILRAKAENRIGLIYGFQNAAQVGDDLERIDIFADLGVRVIQLTYNPANHIGDGAMAPENRGLSPFGRLVIERLNANRIMVDLSHSGEQTCLEAAEVSTRPISINHTGCRAVADLPRNKTDEELRRVASRGGFIGIYFMPFLNVTGHATPDDVVAHIEHAVNVCGEDHVGIGTDGGVTPIDDMPAYLQRLAAEVEARRAAGIGAAGERADTLPFVPGLEGPDQFFDLADRLAARGHSRARIEKILGGNFLAFAREIWG